MYQVFLFSNHFNNSVEVVDNNCSIAQSRSMGLEITSLCKFTVLGLGLVRRIGHSYWIRIPQNVRLFHLGDWQEWIKTSPGRRNLFSFCFREDIVEWDWFWYLSRNMSKTLPKKDWPEVVHYGASNLDQWFWLSIRVWVSTAATNLIHLHEWNRYEDCLLALGVFEVLMSEWMH